MSSPSQKKSVTFSNNQYALEVHKALEHPPNVRNNSNLDFIEKIKQDINISFSLEKSHEQSNEDSVSVEREIDNVQI